MVALQGKTKERISVRDVSVSPDKWVKPWYSPAEIKFNLSQIDWIIEWYEVISDGKWPEKKSGYIDNPLAPRGKRGKGGASFQAPMDVIAEFHWRLSQCGRDGEVFLCVYCKKSNDLKSIMQLLHITQDEFDRLTENVRRYIKGWRKERTYQEFIGHRKGGR